MLRDRDYMRRGPLKEVLPAFSIHFVTTGEDCFQFRLYTIASRLTLLKMELRVVDEARLTFY